VTAGGDLFRVQEAVSDVYVATPCSDECLAGNGGAGSARYSGPCIYPTDTVYDAVCRLAFSTAV
jgi:hypothetical protein